MRNKRLIFIITFILFTTVISGCAKKNISKTELSYDLAPIEAEKNMSSDTRDDSIVENSIDNLIEPEKIITTVSISMETKEFMDTTGKLNELITNYKGYVENSSIYYNNYIEHSGLKNSHHSIRIPKENLNQFVNELKEIGNVISENTSKEDISKAYKDTESRLRLLETKENRILALLDKAEKMEDIIALENQLSSIIYEKENLTINIKDMDDKVDYSTVYFELREVAKLSSKDNNKTPFSTKIVNAFKNSLYFFTSNIENLIISFIYFLPYGVIIGVVVYIVWRFKKKKNNTL
ncbi:DUF4349 domain-containing protein [Tissierella sp. MB52-C2]|uniref:DUF4349 domain-containing protein n=1 Tax=Tissierella sp. MB52-C2 TaxID=3070999 RepID=UPI00280C23CD|nr:DUF4349 domain-containing protein [Tissierella sp. MB52-C2]WMM24448.1 DUF4349 domain-containing protein [Tissierella sp. MB52-C2]